MSIMSYEKTYAWFVRNNIEPPRFTGFGTGHTYENVVYKCIEDPDISNQVIEEVVLNPNTEAEEK